MIEPTRPKVSTYSSTSNGDYCNQKSLNVHHSSPDLVLSAIAVSAQITNAQTTTPIIGQILSALRISKTKPAINAIDRR